MFAIFATLGDFGPPEPPAGEDEVQALVLAARAGDAGASRRLYRLFVARIFRAVRPFCTSDADAEEVTQDTFVRALASLHRYSPREGTRFSAWLATIGFNFARQRARVSRRMENRDEEGLAAASDARDVADGEAAGAALDLARTKRALLAALAELPARDREVVTLRYAAELSADEVAAATGVSAANVRKICERRRAQLLARIEEILETRGGASAGNDEGRPR
ncbi:MAG TPA: RNA polymerase sigma factor [bacterium]|nr:RNA polymerase sigma factor [bacterium]